MRDDDGIRWNGSNIPPEMIFLIISCVVLFYSALVYMLGVDFLVSTLKVLAVVSIILALLDVEMQLYVGVSFDVFGYLHKKLIDIKTDRMFWLILDLIWLALIIVIQNISKIF